MDFNFEFESLLRDITFHMTIPERCHVLEEKIKKDVNNIFLDIESDHFSIDRVIRLGPLVKRTAIPLTHKMNLVVFLTKKPLARFSLYELLTAQNVFDLFFQALKNGIHDEYFHKSIRKVHNDICFVWRGVHVTIEFALNAICRPEGEEPFQEYRKYIAMKQYENFIEFLKIDERLKTESGSLLESYVSFVRNRSVFVKQFIQIAVLWDSSIFLPISVRRRTAFIELIAIRSAEDEEKYSALQKTLLGAFHRFLSRIKNTEKLNVMFFGNGFYNHKDISIDSKKPLLLHPTNPYDNIMNSFTNDLQKVFSKVASETLDRLQQAEKKWMRVGSFPLHEDIFHHSKRIFYPQPSFRYFEQDNKIFKFLKFHCPDEFYCTVDVDKRLKVPLMIPQIGCNDNDRFERFREIDKWNFISRESCIEGLVDVLRSSVSFAVTLQQIQRGHSGCRVTSSRHLKEDDVKAVRSQIHRIVNCSLIDEHKPYSFTWGKNTSHLDYDVTYAFPICSTGTCVYLSCKWNQVHYQNNDVLNTTPVEFVEYKRSDPDQPADLDRHQSDSKIDTCNDEDFFTKRPEIMKQLEQTLAKPIF